MGVVKTITGDLLKSQSQTLVNTVNCVGVMGKGIALAFKNEFPDMFEDYAAKCNRSEVKLGRPFLFKRSVKPWILNFPTKDHWRGVSNLESIVQGLEYLKNNYKDWGITSLAVPPLGCGQGQLEWTVVGRTLYRHLNQLDIPVTLYAPHGTPAEQLEMSFLNIEGNPKDKLKPESDEPRITVGELALVDIVYEITKQPYHWPVGHTIFQKVAFFATELGIPTGLHHAKGSYGPFDPELKKIMVKLINNGLLIEVRLGQMFSLKIGTTFKDARTHYESELDQYKEIIIRITDLFLRMRRTHDAELASTVYFAAKEIEQIKNGQTEEKDVLKAVMDWKIRRNPAFKEEEVGYTIRNLGVLGWLKIRASQDLPLPKEAF